MDHPTLFGVYLFVRDLPTALSFYRTLGLFIDEISPAFARARMTNGTVIEFGTAELTRSYDPVWNPPAGPATNTLNFEFPTADAVDAVYAALTDAGHVGHLPPCDPPWGARFALVDDPDGNVVGLHSPRDQEAERARERESQ